MAKKLEKNHLLTTEKAYLHFVTFLPSLTHFLSGPCSCLCGGWFYTVVKTP